MNDKKLLELACKEMLMEIVRDSSILNEKLTFFQKTILYDKIKEMDYRDILRLVTEDKDKESWLGKSLKYDASALVGHRVGQTLFGGKPVTAFGREYVKGDPRKYRGGLFGKSTEIVQKTIKKKGGGTKTITKKIIHPPTFFKYKGGMKGAALGVGAMYLYRKLSDPCVRNNLGNKQAQIQCRADACKKVIITLRNDRKQCTDDMCRKKIQNTLERYEKQYAQHLKNLSKHQ